MVIWKKICTWCNPMDLKSHDNNQKLVAWRRAYMNSNNLPKFGIENSMRSSPSLTCTPFNLILVFILLNKNLCCWSQFLWRIGLGVMHMPQSGKTWCHNWRRNLKSLSPMQIFTWDYTYHEIKIMSWCTLINQIFSCNVFENLGSCTMNQYLPQHTQMFGLMMFKFLKKNSIKHFLIV